MLFFSLVEVKIENETDLDAIISDFKVNPDELMKNTVLPSDPVNTIEDGNTEIIQVLLHHNHH